MSNRKRGAAANVSEVEVTLTSTSGIKPGLDDYEPASEQDMPCLIFAMNVENYSKGDRGDSFSFQTGEVYKGGSTSQGHVRTYYMNYHDGLIIRRKGGYALILTTVGTARRLLHQEMWTEYDKPNYRKIEWGDKYAVCKPMYVEQQHIRTEDDKRYHHPKRA